MTYTIDDIRSETFPGLTSDEADGLRILLSEWKSHYAKNYTRTLYTDTEQAFKDIGIAMPKQLRRIEYVLGWSAQAVNKPAKRTQFQGISLAGSEDPLELSTVFDGNDFGSLFSQCVQAANRHGMALVSVLPDEDDGVRITGHSAEDSTAIWDYTRGRLAAALTVTDQDNQARPTAFTAFFPGMILQCQKDLNGWVTSRIPTVYDRIPVVAVPNDPQLTSPLGRSRLTNAAMALNDMAVRTLARMEANAEFYSSPQVALAGVDYEAFYGDGGMSENEKFKLAMDRVLALTKDEDGDVPKIQQLQQASMSPHSDMMRTLAMAFAGETGIPPAALGVIQDNPSSAEAIRAQEHDLLVDVTFQNTHVYPRAVRAIAGLAVMVRDNLSAPPADAAKLAVRFADPEFRSLSAETDAVTKLAAVLGGDLSTQTVLLQRLFSDEQVAQIQADARKSAVSGLIGQIAQRVQADPSQVDQVAQAREAAPAAGASDTPPDDADELKKKFDALGVAIRAGVEPHDAAARVGLGDVKFTGMVPVALRDADGGTHGDGDAGAGDGVPDAHGAGGAGLTD